MKGKVQAAVGLLLSVALIAGCGSGGGASSSSGTGTESTASASGSGTSATEFSWDRYSGSSINVMFVEHTLTTDMVNELESFTDKTGIKVEYTIIPEANYFDKVSALLNSKSDTIDIFMTGPYQLWQYASAGYMVDFDKYLNDPSMVSPDYKPDDFYESVLNAERWSGVQGDEPGTGSLWGIPLNFESDVLLYNKKLLKDNGIELPKTTKELSDACKALQKHSGEGTYGFATRGTLSWATLITAYQSFYTTYGAKDFEKADDGSFKAVVNSPEAVEATDWYVDLVKNGGSPKFSSMTYADAVGDVGAGTAAFAVDASGSCRSVCLPDSSEEWENLAIAPLPTPEEGQDAKTQLYCWSLAMNSASKNQDAAWYLIQYLTMPDTMHDMFVAESYANPTRKSVFEADDYQSLLKGIDGYIDTFETEVDNCTMYYTPNSHAFEILERWCQTIQDLVEDKYSSTQDAMDELAKDLDNIANAS